MSARPFTVAAVGDVMLLHPVAASMADPASAAVVRALRDADVAVGNCEISGFDTLTAGPAPQSEAGGFWLNAGPEGIEDLRALGFTMMSRANNHALDFGVGGMAETDRLLAQHQIAYAGTGANLAAARAPAYRTTSAGRVALVSATDTAPGFAMAGDARRDMAGRAGVNRIRTERQRIVDAQTFDALAGALEIAGRQGCELGWVADEGQAIQGMGPTIRKGDCPGDRFLLNDRDVADNLDQLRVARARADLVLFALHTHLPRAGADVPDVIRDLARRAIDTGADMVIGHGPHVLRGIEIHRGKPIFYSLGNFVCHLPKVGYQPFDFYDKTSGNAQAAFADALADGGNVRRWLNDTMWESVMVRVIDEAARRTIEILPIALCGHARGSQLGTPRLADAEAGQRILEAMVQLSAPFGTEIAIVDGIGRIELSD
jgi:poly-gamma-glutamate synthesis protein (capsule biosynthesis protein)